MTISEVASDIGISHAAVYKYFKNKKEPLTSIAQSWLDEVSRSLFPFEHSGYESISEIAHAWLWELSSSKKASYDNAPEMFALYTHYIEQNAELSQAHINELAESYAAATGLANTQEDFAMLQVFTPFFDPHYAPSWGEDFQERFEAVWQIVAPYYKQKDAR